MAQTSVGTLSRLSALANKQIVIIGAGRRYFVCVYEIWQQSTKTNSKKSFRVFWLIICLEVLFESACRFYSRPRATKTQQQATIFKYLYLHLC